MTLPLTIRDVIFLITGASLATALSVVLPHFVSALQWREVHVASIKSHYPRENENSETTLLVFVDGTSGHVEELLCLFPPTLQLVGSNPTYADAVLEPDKKPHWEGLSVVSVGAIGRTYAGGQVGYLCKKVS